MFSLRPCQHTFPLRLWGSHTMCWLFSACPLRCNICHSWPCSVSRKVGPLSLPSSFQLMSGKGWGIFSPHSFRSGYGFLSSYTPQEWPWLQSHGLPLMTVVLTGFQAYCSLPSSVSLGVAKPPTVVSPWMAQLAIFLHSVHTSVCSLFIKVFCVKPSEWARGFLPGQKDTLMAEYFPLRNGDKNCLLGVWTRV